MILQRLVGFLDGECVATAEGQFINCQTLASMRTTIRWEREREREREEREKERERRGGRGKRSEGVRAVLLWSGRRLAGVQCGTTRIIFYFSTFALLPRHPFMPIHPLTRAHLYKNTLRWLRRFRRGNNRTGYLAL